MEMTNDHFFILIADSGKQKTKNSLEVVKNKLQKRKKKKKKTTKKKAKTKKKTKGPRTRAAAWSPTNFSNCICVQLRLASATCYLVSVFSGLISPNSSSSLFVLLHLQAAGLGGSPLDTRNW